MQNICSHPSDKKAGVYNLFHMAFPESDQNIYIDTYACVIGRVKTSL